MTGPRGPQGFPATVNNKSGVTITLVPADLGADVAGAASTAQAAAVSTAAADATGKVTAHTGAVDPHGDRADAAAKYLLSSAAAVTNARTPLAHAGSHAAGGADAVTPAAIAAAYGTGWYNVKDPAYGAAGTGLVDDTLAVQAAINAAHAAGGGVVYFPAGTYALTPGASTPALSVTGTGIRLVGAGRGATTLRKSANGVLLSMSGPASDLSGATHTRYCSLTEMTLNGNSKTGLLLQLYYANNNLFQNLFFTSNSDVCVDTTEFWDSQFINCVWESSGGAADSISPNVWLRNSAAASGFGFSTDSVNMIRFYACRWENFFNGALRIEHGVGNTNNPNGIYLMHNKMESSAMRGGSHLVAAAECRGVYVDGLYCYAGNFFSGYTTPQNVINWAAQSSVLENTIIANGSIATVNSGIDLFSGAGSIAVLRNVLGLYTTAPTNVHIFYEASSTSDFNLQNCHSTVGSQAGGTIPIRYAGHSPLHQSAGAPADSQFSKNPLNGVLAIDSTNTLLYMRLGNAWVTPSSTPGDWTASGNLIAGTVGKGLRVKEGTNGRMGRATLVAGAATVANTAVTAISEIFVTSQADGGTPGWVRVSARTAGTSFTVTSSSNTDTSAVAWMIVEPA